MRFFDFRGNLQRGRRSAANNIGFSSEDAKDASALSKTIRGILERLLKLEGNLPPESTEFEVEFTGTVVPLAHGYRGPIRWWVCNWLPGAAGAPGVYEVSSEEGLLVLDSSNDGKAVIRIEPSQYGLIGR